MWWYINISLMIAETQDWRTIERWVKDESGPAAIKQLLDTIDYKKGELVHFIHISRPSERAPL